MKTTKEQRSAWRGMAHRGEALHPHTIQDLIHDADALQAAEARELDMHTIATDEAEGRIRAEARAVKAERSAELKDGELGQLRSRVTDLQSELESALSKAAEYIERVKDLETNIKRTAQNYRAAAEMDELPEGDMGWRYNMRATADTLEALLTGGK